MTHVRLTRQAVAKMMMDYDSDVGADTGAAYSRGLSRCPIQRMRRVLWGWVERAFEGCRNLQVSRKPSVEALLGSDSAPMHNPAREPVLSKAACCELKLVKSATYLNERDIDADGGVMLPAWARASYDRFINNISSDAFPCWFAGMAQKRGHLRYLFLESPYSDFDAERCIGGIRAYLEELKTLPKKEELMTTMVVMFRPPLKDSQHEDFVEASWYFLSLLRELDPVAWPAHIPENVHDPRWSYCLLGKPLFINVNSPGNKKRRSRNLGPGLTFVLQPRESFDEFLGPGRKNLETRRVIRERVAAYDGMPAFPHLTAYGQGGGLEALQYALPEDNEHSIPFAWTLQCPFLARRKVVNS